MSLILFKWHTGTHVKSTVLIKFKTASLSFWETHWHTTQVYCAAWIQKCVSFFSGGTLAHNSSILYGQNSKLLLFVFRWHTGTRLNYIVQLKFTTASLSFWVAHWHTTEVYCTNQISTASLSFRVAHWHMTQVQSTDRIKNCISLYSGGTLAHDQIHCTARIQNCITFFSGGTRAHYSIILYLANSKLYLFVFGWHTGVMKIFVWLHQTDDHAKNTRRARKMHEKQASLSRPAGMREW
jgi:hypothetical protein